MQGPPQTPSPQVGAGPRQRRHPIGAETGPGQAGRHGEVQRNEQEALGLQSRLSGGPDPLRRHQRAEDEAEGADDGLSGAAAEDDDGVQGYRRKTILHGHRRVPDDDVIDKIISDGAAEEFLSRAIQEHGRGKVVETVEEIQERREAAKEIEKSLLELHHIFLDMAVMVEAQDEHHVMNAAQYTNDGTKNLKIAKQHHKSSRRCLCIGILLLLLLILILVIPIAATFGNSLNPGFLSLELLMW